MRLPCKARKRHQTKLGWTLVSPNVSDHVIDHPIEESIRHLVAEKGFMDVHNGDGFHVVREGAPIHIGRFVGNE